MDLLFHPAFQSAVLPLLLALAGVALLRAVALPWAGWGAVAGLLGAFTVLPGWAWPPASAAQRLPWIVLGAAVVGALLVALRRRRATDADTDTGTGHAAAWVIAMLGLTALAALGGSLLLAQLALMVAICTAVPGVWAWGWPGAGVRVGWPVLLPMAVSALLIAWALPPAGLAGWGRLGLLALALTAPLAAGRLAWARRHPRAAPLLVVGLAAVPVGVALAWLLLAGGAAPAPGADDPYYQPDWSRPLPGGD